MNAELLFPSSENFRFEDDSFNIAVAPYLNSVWITNTVVSHYRKGGVTNGDLPYIRRGGHLYDERFERCFQYGCEQVLPMILGRYVDQLQRDLVNQIHFCQNSDEKIYNFLQQELSSRKIVIWIKRNWPRKFVRPQDETIMHAIKDNNIHEIILLAHQREKKLQSYSRKMKLIGFYQKVVDLIGIIIEK